MSEANVIRAPLPARYALGAKLLLACRRFGADELLLAAEAFEEFAQAAAFENAPIAAREARALASRLRDAAPARARRRAISSNLPEDAGSATASQDHRQ